MLCLAVVRVSFCLVSVVSGCLVQSYLFCGVMEECERNEMDLCSSYDCIFALLILLLMSQICALVQSCMVALIFFIAAR